MYVWTPGIHMCGNPWYGLLWGCLHEQMLLFIYPCVRVRNKLHDDHFQLDLCSCGRGARERLRPRTGLPRWGRGAFKGLVLAPTGPANTAHLPLQFYFHIISISKSCLAALAFASDKRRLRERVEEREEQWEQCTLCADTAMDILVFLSLIH